MCVRAVISTVINQQPGKKKESLYWDWYATGVGAAAGGSVLDEWVISGAGWEGELKAILWDILSVFFK